MSEVREVILGEGFIKVRSDGRVFSKRAKGCRDASDEWHEIGANTKPGEYVSVWLRNADGTRTPWDVHRLVAENFIPNPFPELLVEVNHIDGDRRNNKVENLEWVTHRDNLHEAIRNGQRKIKTFTCPICKREFKESSPRVYPFGYCDDCKQIYRKTNMAKTPENLERQERIRNSVKERGFTASQISKASNRCLTSVYGWLRGTTDYKPYTLDAIERELLDREVGE